MKRALKFFAVLIGVVAAAETSSLGQILPPNQAWVASWGASQQIPETQNALPPEDLRDATLRQIVHLSIGGPAIRVHLSNAFGTEPLHLTAVHIARPVSAASPTIDPATDRPLTFAAKTDVTIPAGAELLSDPLDFPVAPLSDLAVTFHLDAPPARETGHPGSRATSYYVHGDFVSARQLHRPQACGPLVPTCGDRCSCRARSSRSGRPRRLHHRRPRRHHERQ